MVATSNLLSSQLTFVLLQLADVVTTLVAIAYGGAEGNPIIGHFLVIGTVQGLILSKILVLTAALVAVRTGRPRVIRWSNMAFFAIVSWNLFIITMLVFQAHRA